MKRVICVQIKNRQNLATHELLFSSTGSSFRTRDKYVCYIRYRNKNSHTCWTLNNTPISVIKPLTFHANDHLSWFHYRFPFPSINLIALLVCLINRRNLAYGGLWFCQHEAICYFLRRDYVNRSIRLIHGLGEVLNYAIMAVDRADCLVDSEPKTAVTYNFVQTYIHIPSHHAAYRKNKNSSHPNCWTALLLKNKHFMFPYF